MKFGRTERLLGIIVGERAAAVAEIPAISGAGPVRTAEFAYPNDLTLENPSELGRELAQFLERRRFSARRVVLGAPAKWLICSPYMMPPADERTASNVLWVHATDRISPELGPMALDFSGVPNPARPATLLLVGLQRQGMDHMLAMAKAAKLKVAAVTPCAAALAAVTAEHEDRSLVLSLCLDSVELATQEEGQLRSLRHVGSAKNIALLGTELRRTAASDFENLIVWDVQELATVEPMAASAGLTIIRARPQWLDLTPSDLVDGNKGLAAIALAASLRGQIPLTVNFLHPHLKPPKVELAENPRKWLIATAAVVALLCLAVFADLSSLQGQISSNQAKLAAIGPSLNDARRFVSSTEFAEGFQITKPRFLACLRDLTIATPADGQTTFTNFDLQGNMRGRVVGHSNTEQSVLAFTDALSAGGKFADVNCRFDARPAPAAIQAAATSPPAGGDDDGPAPKARPRAGDQISFTVTFSYLPGS